MRDNARNLRLQGGDQIQVYAYRVDYYRQRIGVQPSPTVSPTFRPSFAPTMSSNNEISPDTTDTGGYEIVRYGIVSDLRNGSYSVRLCPIIAGVYEIHVLLKGQGVSNQPFRILDTALSILQPTARGTYYGQYIAQSPYTMTVTHTIASIITSTVEGDGLTATATVAVPSYFMLTVRDPYDNVLRDRYLLPTITMRLDKTPSAPVAIWDYQNGSYLMQFTPTVAGTNILSVLINGNQILGSPYYINTSIGQTNSTYSYAQGPGLVSGITGEPAYFTLYSYDIRGNRMTTYSDVYYFAVTGANSITGYMQPCPFPRDPNHPICDPSDQQAGYYFGVYTPQNAGSNQIEIDLVSDSSSGGSGGGGGRRLAETLTQIGNSPFTVVIYPSTPKAENTDVTGTLTDNTAGNPTSIYLQLRDGYGNALIRSGSTNIECAFLGVAMEWGTVQPFNSRQGLPNQYNYKGFFAGNPNYYADKIVDYQNGTYRIDYNLNQTGQYVLRLALTERGLNATYFNGTRFGELYNRNSTPESYIDELQGRPVNFGSTISWTGDIGGLQSLKGDLGNTSSYYNRYFSRVEASIIVNTSRGIANYFQQRDNLFPSATIPSLPYHFREKEWSARWTGLITAPYAELFKIIVDKDSDSDVHLWIGGRGVQTNRTDLGELVINSTAMQEIGNQLIGFYRFTDKLSREFLLEYQHYREGSAYLRLSWESISTPRQYIPSSVFSHWRNMSHYNLTIHPSRLCSSCSTAWGRSLRYARVHEAQSFLVYGRDRYHNLVQRGGDRPSMVAIGPNGVAFRGKVTDYGNSTYLIQYYPTQSGTFRMYVSIGCCAPNPAIGFHQELERLQPLLIANSPFLVTIDPAPLDPARTIAVGPGLIGANANQVTTFTILYRDIANNPTNRFLYQGESYSASLMIPLLQITFQSLISNTSQTPTLFRIRDATEWNITYEYLWERAGPYRLDIGISLNNGTGYLPIVASPFYTTINPIAPDPSQTICRGNGLRMAYTNQLTHFEIQLYDRYLNKLLTGGNRFYVRVFGDANFSQLTLPIVPTYQDTQNGRYVVSYQVHYAGKHRLQIALLQGYQPNVSLPVTHPGGEGLVGTYYNSLDGAMNAWQGSNLSQAITTADGPVYQRLDAKIAFTWSQGYLLPITDAASRYADQNLTSSLLSLRNLGQSVRWSGYIVCPRSDYQYQIYTVSKNLEVTIFLDERLVFDSLSGEEPVKLPMTQFSAYAIVIIGKVRSSITEIDPIEIDLRWSSSAIRDQSISTFYLYPTAQEIQFSPFPVEVLS